MKSLCAAMLALLVAAGASGCHGRTRSAGCTIEGPDHLLPAKVGHVRLGMSLRELEAVLGVADYSPIDGQFYFSTGGQCPLQGVDRPAACGVVAEFRLYRDDGDAVVTDALQSCWWGAIGE